MQLYPNDYQTMKTSDFRVVLANANYYLGTYSGRSGDGQWYSYNGSLGTSINYNASTGILTFSANTTSYSTVNGGHGNISGTAYCVYIGDK